MTTTDDVRRARELLAGHDPALEHDPLDDRRRRSIIETILARAHAGDQPARAAGPRARRPRITTRSVVFAAFLAVWAVAVVTVLSRQGTDAAAPLEIRKAVVARADPSPPRSARAVLLFASSHASSASAASTSGPVRYQRQLSAYAQTFGTAPPFSALVPEVESTWAAPDGSGEIRHEYKAPIWPSEVDRKRWEDAGSPELQHGTRTTHVKAADLRSSIAGLSTDPATLRDQLERRVPAGLKDADGHVFETIHELLWEPLATPELRGSLLRVAAGLRGVTLVGAVTDQLGRPGEAIGMTTTFGGSRTRVDLIFDAATGQLLQSQEVLLDRADFIHGPRPVQLSFTIYAGGGAVAEVGDAVRTGGTAA
jgi:hypothetical protein